MPFHLPSRRTWSSITPRLPGLAQIKQLVTPLCPEDTLQRAVSQLHHQHLPAIPVVDDGILVGWVTTQRIASVMADGVTDLAAMPVGSLLDPVPATVDPSSSLQEVDAVMRDTGATMLPVVASDGWYDGCVLHSDLLAAMNGHVAAPRIGGMATPLGVYLTTGVVSGGAGWLGLLLTGATMACSLWLVQVVYVLSGVYLYQHFPSSFLLGMLQVLGVTSGHQLSQSPLRDCTGFLLVTGLVTVGFLLLLRYGPFLAGFHAAEHQTVNAIEAGEALTPDAVARMSRVHPRCGTNLCGLMSLTYLGITLLAMLLATPSGQHNVLLVTTYVFWFAILVMLNWRRVGGWVQLHLTTRRATPREIASGIKAGQEILQRHQAIGGLTPRPWQRVWHMGLAQVMMGAILMNSLLQLCEKPLDYLVNSLVK